jgi:hypothetical protein
MTPAAAPRAECVSKFGSETCDAINALPIFDPSQIRASPAQDALSTIVEVLDATLASILNPLTLTLIAFCVVLGWKRAPWHSPAIAAAVYVVLFLLLGSEFRAKLWLDPIAYRPIFLFVHAALGYATYIVGRQL